MLGNAEIMEHTRKPIDESDVVPNVCKLAYLIVYNEFFKVYFLWVSWTDIYRKKSIYNYFLHQFFLHGTGQCIYISLAQQPTLGQDPVRSILLLCMLFLLPPPKFLKLTPFRPLSTSSRFFFLLLSVIDFFVFTL